MDGHNFLPVYGSAVKDRRAHVARGPGFHATNSPFNFGLFVRQPEVFDS
jgi:hypothetical protein